MFYIIQQLNYNSYIHVTITVSVPTLQVTLSQVTTILHSLILTRLSDLSSLHARCSVIYLFIYPSSGGSIINR